MRTAIDVSCNVNIAVNSPSSCSYSRTVVLVQLREQPFGPSFGRQIIVDVAIHPRVKARGAVALQSSVEIAAALTEMIIPGIAQCQDRKFQPS
jgi:hypothetical protein